MIYDMTVQVRVTNIKEGQNWYETLIGREPDFIPHEGFIEWELIPGCWLQVAEGTPTKGNGPIRLGVEDIESERDKVVQALKVEAFEIHSRAEVPVKWGTFSDPWGNRIGFYEHLHEEEKLERIKSIQES